MILENSAWVNDLSIALQMGADRMCMHLDVGDAFQGCSPAILPSFGGTGDLLRVGCRDMLILISSITLYLRPIYAWRVRVT